MTQEQKAQAYDEALGWMREMYPCLTDSLREDAEHYFPELAESEDENLKNKSGYYKDGKFWKASTLWNATKNKIPQRVFNRYILQECTWNIGNLQDFANEVKNVQEVSLDYPIILDMNGNIIDGAHRVVKAYLEGKDIDIVYIGDDEWPEPDYDEEKAVRRNDDERIKKSLIKFLTDIKEISESGRTSWAVRKEDAEMCKSFLDYLGKQKVQNEITIEQVYKEFITPEKLKDAKTNKYIRAQLLWELMHNGIITEVDYQYLTDDKRKPWTAEEYQKEQKPVECIEFDNEFEKQVSHLLASVLNGEWEYDEGFVKHAAQSLLGYAKNELKSNYCLYGGDPNVGRCRWCYAACSARLADVHTDEEKEYVRTIKSIISDFIRDKKPENLAYYQRIYDWLDGRHVPFSCGHENGKSAWSEEDENALEYIHDLISWGYSKKFMDAQTAHDMRKWVNEHLRPDTFQNGNSHWKPSEEQMSYLLSLHQGGEEQKPLRELIEQLKKLM